MLRINDNTLALKIRDAIAVLIDESTAETIDKVFSLIYKIYYEGVARLALTAETNKRLATMSNDQPIESFLKMKQDFFTSACELRLAREKRVRALVAQVAELIEVAILLLAQQKRLPE